MSDEPTAYLIQCGYDRELVFQPLTPADVTAGRRETPLYERDNDADPAAMARALKAADEALRNGDPFAASCIVRAAIAKAVPA